MAQLPNTGVAFQVGSSDREFHTCSSDTSGWLYVYFWELWNHVDCVQSFWVTRYMCETSFPCFVGLKPFSSCVMFNDLPKMFNSDLHVQKRKVTPSHSNTQHMALVSDMFFLVEPVWFKVSMNKKQHVKCVCEPPKPWKIKGLATKKPCYLPKNVGCGGSWVCMCVCVSFFSRAVFYFWKKNQRALASWKRIPIPSVGLVFLPTWMVDFCGFSCR